MKDAKESSRYPFILERRGGPLTKEEHLSLMKWALLVIEHGNKTLKLKISKELEIAYSWKEEKASVKDCMDASRRVHKAARDIEDDFLRCYTRAVGQSIATAHMADHSMGASLYIQKCFKMKGLDIEKERAVHYSLLQDLVPLSLYEEVIERLQKKEKSFSLR